MHVGWQGSMKTCVKWHYYKWQYTSGALRESPCSSLKPHELQQKETHKEQIVRCSRSALFSDRSVVCCKVLFKWGWHAHDGDYMTWLLLLAIHSCLQHARAETNIIDRWIEGGALFWSTMPLRDLHRTAPSAQTKFALSRCIHSVVSVHKLLTCLIWNVCTHCHLRMFSLLTNHLVYAMLRVAGVPTLQLVCLLAMVNWAPATAAV